MSGGPDLNRRPLRPERVCNPATRCFAVYKAPAGTVWNRFRALYGGRMAEKRGSGAWASEGFPHLAATESGLEPPTPKTSKPAILRERVGRGRRGVSEGDLNDPSTRGLQRHPTACSAFELGRSGRR
jgi:hypothetical protein